ncbi:hypothetical protein ABZ863_27045 [Saccharomonospora sp. NPDC046836]|uniref:hypothetical protein n=1 Tax=Saccharomonospora sp. NPDC046836 TaxID=3156921 RepID=UPI0033C1EF29
MSTSTATSVRNEAGDGRAPVLTLVAALLGFFVITLDAVIVNVVLPFIQSDLGGR